MIKEHTFEAENLPGADITIDLEYTYERDDGNFNGHPDTWHPPSEESKITLPVGWEDIVIQSYMKAAREAIKAIESDLVPQLEWEGKPREWYQEDCSGEDC